MRCAAFGSLSAAICIAVMTSASVGQAQVANIVATQLFETSAGNEQNGLAFDDALQRLYTIDSTDALRAYDLDGSLVLGPLALLSPGRPGETGLHFIREATTIGGVAVSAGTLVFVQAGAGNDPQDANETTLYAIEETTGDVISAEALTTGLVTPPAGCPDVLKDQAKGLGYSTRRDVFVSVDIDCQGIAEIGGGDVTGFFGVPGGISGTSGGGGVTVHPSTGNVWLAGALSEGNLAEFSESGVLLRRFDVLDGGTASPIAPRRIEFDATGERLFLLTFGAEVYVLDGMDLASVAVPGLGPWATGILILAFTAGGVGIIRGRVLVEPGGTRASRKVA
jgi:hypothetical protein